MPNDADQPSLPTPASVPICSIGASAGGIEALQHFFAALPVDLDLAYVVIVHLAPDRKSDLPAIIARRTTMPVLQLDDHQIESLAPNSIYVISPDRKLEITDTSVGASPFDQPRGQRTAIDLFFRSLAEAKGDGYAVVLSGTGSDGAARAKEYRSTTEELETSKEELQSINEELRTANQELNLKFEEVSRSHSDLENLIAELEASQQRLSRQALELLEQDRNRDDFIATLGHELRNPMAAIQNSLAVISASDPASQRALTILRRQSLHMAGLLNDLLDVTRARHAKLRLQRASVNVEATVRAALDSVRSQAEKKGLRLEYQAPPSPPSVDADAERLAQILDNLLRNAIACTDAGAVTVVVAQQDGTMRITVRDTGEGIAPEDIAKVFQAYRQVDPERRSDGLGLALVKMLVEAHGGTIEVHSGGRGAGSTFSLTLPAAGTTAATQCSSR